MKDNPAVDIIEIVADVFYEGITKKRLETASDNSQILWRDMADVAVTKVREYDKKEEADRK